MNLVKLGTQTQWGKVSGVMYTAGERYYFILDPMNTVSMMPGDVVEDDVGVKDAEPYTDIRHDIEEQAVMDMERWDR